MMADGSLTKEMVAEMEKSMGLNLDEFVRILDQPGLQKNLNSVEPEVREMIDMFKQLHKIKKS